MSVANERMMSLRSVLSLISVVSIYRAYAKLFVSIPMLK